MLDWLESILKVFGEKVLLPNWDSIRSWFLKFPLLVATLSIVPVFGVILAYGLVLDQGKGLLLIFADILMGFALPIYPFYKLLMAFDVWVLTKRRRNGKELRHFECFWN